MLSGKILINLQIFPRNICSLCPNIRNFRSGCSGGTLPLNILIEFVTLRLEAGHCLQGWATGIAKYLDGANEQMQCRYELNCYLNKYKAPEEPASVTGTGCLFVFWQMKVVKLEQMHHSLAAALQERQWGKEVEAGFASAWAWLFTLMRVTERVTNTDRPSLRRVREKHQAQTFIAAKVLFHRKSFNQFPLK